MFCNTFQSEDHILLWRDHLGWLFFLWDFLTLLAKCGLAKEWKDAERWELAEGDKKTTCKVKEVRIGGQLSGQLGCPRSEPHSCLQKSHKVGYSVNFLD